MNYSEVSEKNLINIDPEYAKVLKIQFRLTGIDR
jgi:hypothetical protein